MLHMSLSDPNLSLFLTQTRVISRRFSFKKQLVVYPGDHHCLAYALQIQSTIFWPNQSKKLSQSITVLCISKYPYKLRTLSESQYLSQVNNDFYSVCIVLDLYDSLLV